MKWEHVLGTKADLGWKCLEYFETKWIQTAAETLLSVPSLHACKEIYRFSWTVLDGYSKPWRTLSKKYYIKQGVNKKVFENARFVERFY